MAGFTNKGKAKILDLFFRFKWGSGSSPTPTFHVALATSATAPTADTNIMSDLTEIAAGNGYVQGGFALSRNSTDFATMTEDDTNDRGLVVIKNVSWTASGGPIPASGSGARYAVLTADYDTDGAAATAASGNRVILGYWDLSSDRSLLDTQTLLLQGLEMRLNET